MRSGRTDVMDPWAVLAIHRLARWFWLGVHSVATWAILRSSVSSTTKIVYLALLMPVAVLYVSLIWSKPAYAVEESPDDEHHVILDACHQTELAVIRDLCSLCGAVQRPEVKHCKWCNKCMRGWDHHCVFVAGCITRSNHSLFWLYLLAQFALVFPGMHTAIHYLGHGPWRQQLLPGFAVYFLFVSLVVIGFMLAGHTLLACTGLTTYTWKKQAAARKRKQTAPSDRESNATTVPRRKLTASQMLGNFAWFLWSSKGYANRIARQQEEGSKIHAGAYSQTLVGQAARAIDKLWDNNYWSCC